MTYLSSLTQTILLCALPLTVGCPAHQGAGKPQPPGPSASPPAVIPSWARHQPRWVHTVLLLKVHRADETMGALDETARVLEGRLTELGVRNRTEVNDGRLVLAVDARGDKQVARVREALAPHVGLALQPVDDTSAALDRIAEAGKGDGVEVYQDRYTTAKGKEVKAPYLWTSSRAALTKRLGLVASRVSLPEGKILLLVAHRRTMKNGYRTVLLDGKVWLDDRHIIASEVTTLDHGPPAVTLRFNDEGRKRLAEVTTRYLGRRLAILSEGRLMSMPVVMEPVTGGTIQLTGGIGPGGDPLFDEFLLRATLQRVEVLELVQLQRQPASPLSGSTTGG